MPYWRYIKKTNTRVDAYAAQIAKESEDVQALMTEQMTDLTGKMQAQKDAASADVSAADAGFEKVMTKVADELAAAEKASDNKFVLNADMAAQRADLDKYLASAVNNINARNEESATNIATFSAESLAGIASAKEDFSMRLDTLTNVVLSTTSLRGLASRCSPVSCVTSRSRARLTAL